MCRSFLVLLVVCFLCVQLGSACSHAEEELIIIDPSLEVTTGASKVPDCGCPPDCKCGCRDNPPKPCKCKGHYSTDEVVLVLPEVPSPPTTPESFDHVVDRAPQQESSPTCGCSKHKHQKADP